MITSKKYPLFFFSFLPVRLFFLSILEVSIPCSLNYQLRENTFVFVFYKGVGGGGQFFFKKPF